MKIITWQFEVAVRMRLNLETLTLLPRLQSAVFFKHIYVQELGLEFWAHI